MDNLSRGVRFRDVRPEDFERCIEIRGLTRDNPIPAEVLREVGVTRESWVPRIEHGDIVGVVTDSPEGVVGFCSGDAKTGEVLVLALLPEYEGLGLGKRMLSLVTERLFGLGFEKLWLAASPCPGIRAHGFYRHLGWRPTGEQDQHGDEILELPKS
jgi:ribosomal protein S18 acetylase RimI-like enzyme